MDYSKNIKNFPLGGLKGRGSVWRGRGLPRHVGGWSMTSTISKRRVELGTEVSPKKKKIPKRRYPKRRR